MPAYNEEKRIGKTLVYYSQFFDELMQKGKMDYEIIVVINNTRDRTHVIVEEAQRVNRHIRFLNLKEGGKGLAVIAGFKDALQRDATIIGFVDADMATPPTALYELMRSMNGHDGIIAARWRPDSTIINPWGVLGNLKSFVFNTLVRILFLFPYRDTQCGAKLFKREAIASVSDGIGITRWAFDIELLYKMRKQGFSIAEAPTVWENKEDTKIKLIKASAEMFLAVVRLRLVHSPLSFVVSAYDALPEQLKIHHRIWR